jgi:hypothetical protein
MRTLVKLLEGFKRFLSEAKWYLFVPIAILISTFRRRRQITAVWPEGPMPLTPNIVLFMHFDKYGRVRKQILDYISEFHATGRAVVFVTNSGFLTGPAMADLQKICAGIIIRKNRGYDFGAWCDAVEHLKLPLADTQEVIFANDSVFGPLKPIAPMLNRIDYTKADIWGLTESWQYRYHLQSFFFAFGPVALRAPVFKTFWDGIKPVAAKVYVVRNYEIGITQTMIKAGLRCAALWPYQDLIKRIDDASFEALIIDSETDVGKADPILRNRRLHALRLRDAVARRIALNPTADLWRQLLQSGFPFLKRELPRENPTDVDDVSDWINLVREDLGADPDPIIQDLRLMLRDQAP